MFRVKVGGQSTAHARVASDSTKRRADIIRTSAKSLAERAGAAQYAVHIEEELSPDEIAGGHDLRKRLSDDSNAFDDSDYEIYQGVVGRPGIDFPVLTGIPQTTFNCRKFGNGYFADLETECQVFHICEGGKKISFLCPNGTIFQQTDLICDWWFKVNCAASPGHYAESSEILSRAQHRYKPKTETSSESISRESSEPTRKTTQTTTKTSAARRDSPNRNTNRIGAGEQADLQKGIPNESVDFEDISQTGKQTQGSVSSKADRRGKAFSNNNRDGSKSTSEESQNLAESSSFVNSQNSFNGYHYKEPNDKKFTIASERKPQATTTSSVVTTAATVVTTTTERPTTTFSTNDRTTSVLTTTVSSAGVKQQDSSFNGYYYQEPDRASRKLEHTRLPYNHITEATTTVPPTPYPRRGSTTYKDSQTTQTPFIIKVPDTTVNSVPTTGKLVTTTYATTRRRPTTTTSEPFETTFRDTTTRSRIRTTTSTSPPLIRTRPSATTNARYETSRTTPFYTPTVPTVLASRPTVSNRVSIKETTTNPTPPTASSSATFSEHAMEMMKTLQELKLDGPTQSTDAEKESGRPGLIIPPSSGPETLHSLALYFATAVDNLANQTVDSTTKKAEIPGLENLDVEIGNVTKLQSTLVSDATARRYESLFGTSQLVNETAKPQTSNRISENLELPSFNYGDSQSLKENDLDTELSRGPVLAAAGTPQLRELAQVFTHALSAYLHDPITFRRVLAEIRPTEPPTTKSVEFLTNRGGRNEDFNNGTGATYLPTVPTQMATATTPLTPTTEDLEVLDFSDVTASTVRKDDSAETTTLPTTSRPEATTTNGPRTTHAFAATTTTLLKESLKSLDRVPASRILTEPLENFALNQYTSNALLDTTTETSNPLAMEINGGLEAETSFPYLEEDNDSENAQNASSYKPAKLNSNKTPSPYGLGVKPSDSTPIHDQSPTTASSFGSVDSSGLSFELLPPTAVNKAFDLPTHDILPPLDDNDLHSAHSQTIFGDSKNKVDQSRAGKNYKANGKQTKSQENITEKPRNGHYITQIPITSTLSPEKIQRTTVPDTGKYTDSKSTLAYSVFLDPLTINDGLMDSHERTTITPSPNTYLPTSTLIPPNFDFNRITTEPTSSKYASRLSLKELAAGTSYDTRQGKARVVSTVIPIGEDDYVTVMQRKANEMFGQLNDTSANHLMNVMKHADKSKTVRRLILLLIQTCDDDYNKTVETTRTALLNALIGMDGKIDDENELQIINANAHRSSKRLNLEKSANLLAPAAQTLTTSTQIPITTYHRPIKGILESRLSASTIAPQYLSESTSTFSSINLDSSTITGDLTKSTGYTEFTESDLFTTLFPTESNGPTTTTQGYRTTTTTTTTTTTSAPTMTTTRKSKTRQRQRHTQQSQNRNSRRIAKDLDQYLTHQGDTTFNVDSSHQNSDARALELLKSLYSIAGRFGK